MTITRKPRSMTALLSAESRLIRLLDTTTTAHLNRVNPSVSHSITLANALGNEQARQLVRTYWRRYFRIINAIEKQYDLM